MSNTTPWKPSKGVAYLLAVLTVWPILYFVFFLFFMAMMFASAGSQPSTQPDAHLFMYIFPLHLLTMLLMMGLTATYVVHAFRSDELPSDKRMLWVVVLFLGNLLAFPIYWWFYLRPGRPGTAPTAGESS